VFGKEFAYHHILKDLLGIEPFFAYPLPLIGERIERKYKWNHSVIFPQEIGFLRAD